MGCGVDGAFVIILMVKVTLCCCFLDLFVYGNNLLYTMWAKSYKNEA
jgi:hypothetical protein